MTSEIGELMVETILKQTRPERQLGKYKVALCDKCKAPQMSAGEKTFKCLKCEKVNNFFNRDGHLRQYLLMSNSPQEAAKWVSESEIVCEYVRTGGNSNALSSYFNNRKNGQTKP